MTVTIVWVSLFAKKKKNKRRFEVLSTLNSILSDKKVSPIESNFIKEVIDKKSFFFLFWCRLTAVLPSAYVEIAQTQIFGRCGI